MKIEYLDKDLEKMAQDISYKGKYDQAVVKMFRKRIQFIDAALDEKDLYSMKSLHFEKLSGSRKGQHSIRLNDKWRLILQFKKEKSEKMVVVVSITDYH